MFKSRHLRLYVVLAERLRRETANFMGCARASSNLAHDVFVSLPERSKGTRLGRVIFVCESSNLSTDIIFTLLAQWIARPTSNRKVAGSSPA